jgi:8-oxo-dGTP diphosphatase
MNCTLCNMCMIEDTASGRVLVQHRLAKPTNLWSGLTFPGGHVEAGESITASTVREIREETGLTVSNLRMCGVVEWEVPEKPKSTVWQDNIPNSKYIVFMFRTSTFRGELKSSAEGRMEWMTLDEMRRGGLAPHMEEYIRVLLDDDVPQAYGISGSGRLNVIVGKPEE